MVASHGGPSNNRKSGQSSRISSASSINLIYEHNSSSFFVTQLTSYNSKDNLFVFFPAQKQGSGWSRELGNLREPSQRSTRDDISPPHPTSISSSPSLVHTTSIPQDGTKSQKGPCKVQHIHSQHPARWHPNPEHHLHPLLPPPFPVMDRLYHSLHTLLHRPIYSRNHRPSKIRPYHQSPEIRWRRSCSAGLDGIYV